MALLTTVLGISICKHHALSKKHVETHRGWGAWFAGLGCEGVCSRLRSPMSSRPRAAHSTSRPVPLCLAHSRNVEPASPADLAGSVPASLARPAALLPCCLAAWPSCSQGAWPVAWLPDCLAVRLRGHLFGRVLGWLPGCLAAWMPGCLAS